MHIFDYSFLYKGSISAEIASLASTIAALNAISGERRRMYGGVYNELTTLARVQSVKGSNAIEGIVTTDARIREIVQGNSAPQNHSEMEIAGYRDALDEVHSRHEDLSLTEDTIRHLHRIMLRISADENAGIYKREDNLIMEYDEAGRRKVRFVPVPAAETRDAMEQMILAYVEVRDQTNTNKLLLIPCVMLDFLCIHPFTDGNGRVSRLLTLLLLYKAGYDIGRYVSFEEQINLSRDYYYDSLQESSKSWNDNINSYEEFMKNFLATLYRCYKELDKRFSTVNGKKIKKTERIEQTVLNSVLPISKAEICEALPDISPTTVESVLGKMVKAGSVKKIGQARATKYANAKHLRT